MLKKIGKGIFHRYFNSKSVFASSTVDYHHEDLPNQLTDDFPLDINLGIDFGTSFTKVCFRDVGEEQSGIVTFGTNFTNKAMIPSVVVIDDNGILYLAKNQDYQHQDTKIIPYLKMHLAGMSLPISLPISIFDGRDDDLKIAALSSWFLCQVIYKSSKWLLKNEGDRCRGRKINWSANICVPVEWCDSPKKSSFQQVAAVAWYWFAKDVAPTTFENLIQTYKETTQEIDTQQSDCHVLEEVVAAAQSFLKNRSALDGAYVFFDIGGGTIDGCALKFVKKLNRINCLSAKIKPLGVSSIAHSIREDTNIESVEIENFLTTNYNNSEKFHNLHNVLDAYRKQVQKLVGSVVMEGSEKDTSNWKNDMQNLPVFLSGGGSESDWFCNAISSTYDEFDQKAGHIPPYKVSEIPVPDDLSMNGIPIEDFRRFSVAYGLSIPYGEIHDIGLPNLFNRIIPPPQVKPQATPYLDTKELT